MSDHDNCKVSNNYLTINQKVALLCDSCNNWHCFSCMGVGKKCFDVLNDSKLDTSMVKVVCKQCLKDYCPLQINNHLMEIKRDITKKNIEDLPDKIITSAEKQDESLQIVKRHNAEAKTSWANAVKMGLESTNSIKAVQTAVKVSFTKTHEIEEGDRSIIMFNHPESTKQIQLKERKMTLNLFINQGLQISEQPVQSFSDLVDIPKIKLDLSRLFFCHKVCQIKVIENVSSLKGALEDFSRVSVCIDRNEDKKGQTVDQ